MRSSLLCAAIIAAIRSLNLTSAAEPRVLVDGYQLTQLAKEPGVVTPIGAAFDGRGRLLIIESHTHQRQEDYDGPPSDRVLLFADTDDDGQVDSSNIFAEGFRHAMNVAVRDDGAVYVVTRSDVHVLRDEDGDGRADANEVIVSIKTDEDYPHNGLSGIVFDDQGGMYLGLGENFGGEYRLVGSDGKFIKDSGGSGAVFYCNQDGSELRHHAIGFWNPFSLCLAGGRLFCVDNDPDASPPCRLIDVVHGGDYGHRWEYGRAGVHPLQAWDGELPGTLPMVCGTGEAPTAVLFHRGWLWATSWGDHRIERYSLAPREDGSYSATREVVVQGDPDFRPTGMAVAPDGSLVFGDWVDRSYPVHQKGRIWRLVIGDDANEDVPSLDAAPPMEARVAGGEDATPRSDALRELELLRWHTIADSAKKRRERIEPLTRRAFNGDGDAAAKLMAVRWIAENRATHMREQVATLLDGEIPDERYFLAVLAALDWLEGDGEPRGAGISDELLIRELENDARSPKLHAIALKLISPENDWLTMDRLRNYLTSEHLSLRLEAVRKLASLTTDDRFALLVEIAAGANHNSQLRAEAAVGLAAAASDHRELLSKLARSDDDMVAGEAARVLRLSRIIASSPEPRPAADDIEAWNELLSADHGDVESGRRLFFSSVGPRCGVCHQHSGKGGRIGPDLTLVGRQQSRERIIASIMRPSEEVAPRYQPWTLVTDDGRTVTGLKMPQGGDNGRETFSDSEGNLFTLRADEIDVRQMSAQSIMPAGLETTMSVDDLRDIVAFLMAE